MKINYFNIGYTDGLKDAKAGKKKDARRGVPKLKSLLPLVGKTIMESYLRGYKYGYRDGTKKKI